MTCAALSGISVGGDAAPLIIEGLKKLEYRGYDSFGVATLGMGIDIAKHQGRISEKAGSAAKLQGKIGIRPYPVGNPRDSE